MDKLVIRNDETVTINLQAMQEELTALRASVAELEELLRRTAARAVEGPQITSEKLTREDSP